MSFINTGADEALLKSLYGDSVHVDQDELCKAMNRAGLVQKEVQVRGKNGQTFTRKQWVKASDVVKDNTSSSKTGGPVDISKFSFTNYLNPDGQNRNGYKTYRDSLQSVANETEKAATRVLSTYGGSMKPYDQLSIEFSNINGHSSYRDMISNSSEQGLKDAKSAILTRQRELLESVKDYTKWDSSQRKWVKDDSQSSSSSQKKTDTNDKKTSDVQFDDFRLTWKDGRGGHVERCKTVEELKDKLKYYGLPESLADFSPKNINKKSMQEKGYTENSYKRYSVCAYPTDDFFNDMNSKSSKETPTNDIPDDLKDKLKHPDDPSTPFKSQYKGFDITRFYSGKIEISKNGEKVLSTYSKPQAAEYLVNNSKNASSDTDDKDNSQTQDSGQSSKREVLMNQLKNKDVLDSKLNPHGYKVGDYLKVKQGRSYTTYQVKSLEKSKDISGKEHVYLNCIEIMKNGQVYNFNHIILADSKLISYKIDEPLTLKDPSGKRSKDNFQQTSSGSKLSPADAKAKTKEVTKNVTDRNAFMEKAKAQGITWKENDHAGINWMRCCMAMNKHFENGGSFEASDNQHSSNTNFSVGQKVKCDQLRGTWQVSSDKSAFPNKIVLQNAKGNVKKEVPVSSLTAVESL